MPKCWDRTAKAMADRGYNLVRYPRADIEPLNVLADVRGTLEWLGPITEIWSSTSAMPSSRISKAPTFEYVVSNEYKGAFGLKILEGLLQNVGGAGSARISRQTRLTFTYTEPERCFVPPLEVGSFLRDGDIDLDNPFLAAFIKSDDSFESDFFVITEVLRSKHLTVVATNESAAELAADVKAMERLGTASASVSTRGKNSNGIVFEGSRPITFAFKAFEIAFKQGEWSVLSTLEESEYLSASDEASDEASDTSGGFIFSDGSPITIQRRDT